MPANFYQDLFTELSTFDGSVLQAWIDAKNELAAQGVPETIFLELRYGDGKIFRLWDGSDVTGLSESEQLRLYPQLNGLFRKASLALLMP